MIYIHWLPNLSWQPESIKILRISILVKKLQQSKAMDLKWTNFCSWCILQMDGLPPIGLSLLVCIIKTYPKDTKFRKTTRVFIKLNKTCILFFIFLFFLYPDKKLVKKLPLSKALSQYLKKNYSRLRKV